MQRMTVVLCALLAGLVAATASGARPGSPDDLYDRAKRAIAAGNVVPDRDLAPLVNVLRAPASTEDLRTAIDKIVTLADDRSGSPAAVRSYLLEQSTPLLLKIGADGPTPFARGEAVMALREMGAPRAVLEQAAAIANHDRDDFVRSRGEILDNYIKSMPASGLAAQVKSGGGTGEAQAIAALKARNLPVSADQLRRSAFEGNAPDIQLLLDAGVNVNSGEKLSDSALYSGVFSGCGAKQGETEGLVNAVNVLVVAGADLKRKDDNGNTILISAAQMCGPKIVTRLIAGGADVKAANNSGMTALSMALLMHHPDSAEVLVNKGARLTPAQVQMLTASITDARGKAVLQRASGK
jgi:hypothetical protein